MSPSEGSHDIEPREAAETYLKYHESELSQKPLEAHGYRLRHFIRWAEENDITSMAELTPRHYGTTGVGVGVTVVSTKSASEPQ